MGFAHPCWGAAARPAGVASGYRRLRALGQARERSRRGGQGFHDGSATGPHQVGPGNNWVIAAIVRLAFCSRPVALPVLARLVHKDLKPAPASRLALALQMTAALACGARLLDLAWPDCLVGIIVE